MYFETEHPRCELFLSSEELGFLMLSSSGENLRKWQGLTVGTLSVFADLEWSFSHSESSLIVSEQNQLRWLKTTRTAEHITRHWELSCGCTVRQMWQWAQHSSLLEISWKWTRGQKCTYAGSASKLQVFPLWTLCPAGHSQAGGGHAQITHDPKQSGWLDITSDLFPATIRISGLLTDRTSDVLDRHSEFYSTPQPWHALESPESLELPTPLDASRGENITRSVLKTHTTELNLMPESSAFISIHFSGKVLPHGSNFHSHQPGRAETTDHQPAVSVFSLESRDSQREWQRAYCNATESLNQLIRRRSDGKLGLQAGLPWFTQFWTRDLCHSFRAAFLWSGRLDDGQSIICELWESSSNTIPNYTTESATTNNSADALPLLLLSTADLIDVVGLNENLKEHLSRIKFHLHSAVTKFSSSQFFIHGPADTWMDAQKLSPEGELVACSPRANRAFEIQAFWIAALARWSRLLPRSSPNEESEARTFASATQQGLRLLRSFFYNSERSRWADHLRTDGTQDLSLRPNLLLGFNALQRAGVLEQLLSRSELKSVIDDMLECDLIVPYGVRTLSPETSVRHDLPINDIFSSETAYIHENKIHFHPYHEFGSRQGLEHPDWAYHNGTIWPWLSHAAIELLLATSHIEAAQQLTQTLVWHSVHGTEGGALTELLDGLSSHSAWSWPKGAPHQAWSEAALIHAVAEGWLGLQLQEQGNYLEIRISHWAYLGDFSFSFICSRGRLELKKNKNECRLRLQSLTSTQQPLNVMFIHEHTGDKAKVKTDLLTLSPNTPLTLKLTHS